MVGRSKKNKRGGEKLDDIQSQLNDIQTQLNDMKSSTMSEAISMPISMPESMSEAMPESMSEAMPESVKVDKTWVDDKTKKFRDGNGGRVSLSFSRIMTLFMF